MTTLSSTGLTRTRLDERIAQLTASMQTIFGADINVAADSIDGQALGVFAEAISNLDQLMQDVYNSFNPQSATGLALSRLVQLNGIRRIAGAYSTVTIRCTGVVGTLIPAGSLVKSAATSASFQTLTDATIPIAGFIDVPSRATVFGATAAAIGTLTKIDTPVYGWQLANNVAIAVLGASEETDELLRTRRLLSTSTPALAIIDAMAGGLANISGVLQAVVLENVTDVLDGRGLPPHSISCIVNGGADADIANVIWKKKTLGATMNGATTVSVADLAGGLHVINFSRPTLIPVYISVTVSQRVGWPSDGA